MKQIIKVVIFVLMFFMPVSYCVAKSADTKPASILKLRVATYNILSGRSFKQILVNIRSVHPDIVCLEETPMEKHGARSIARALGMEYQFFPYSKRSGIGIAILATGKLTPLKFFTMKKERNFALASKLDIGNRKILVVAMHLKSLPRPLISGLLKSMGKRGNEAKEVVEFVSRQKLPAIVAGDCNTLPFTPAYITLSSKLRDSCVETKTSGQHSIFIGKSGYRIDHIFVRGHWNISKCQVSPLPGSDHRLVWADIELVDGKLPVTKATQPQNGKN